MRVLHNPINQEQESVLGIYLSVFFEISFHFIESYTAGDGKDV